MLIIDLIILCFILYVIVSILYWTIRNGISPSPTSFLISHKIEEILPEVHGDIFELGSGWGNLAVLLAKRFPDSTVYGFETSEIPYFFSLLWKKWSGVNNLVLKRRDFFQADLSTASLVVCYLYPEAMEKLSTKLKKELPEGCYIISNTFSLPSWQPEEIIEVNDIYSSKIYVYRKS